MISSREGFKVFGVLVSKVDERFASCAVPKPYNKQVPTASSSQLYTLNPEP